MFQDDWLWAAIVKAVRAMALRSATRRARLIGGGRSKGIGTGLAERLEFYDRALKVLA